MFTRAVPAAIASGPSSARAVAVVRCVAMSITSTSPASVGAVAALARVAVENRAYVVALIATTAATGRPEVVGPPGVGKPPPPTGPVPVLPWDVNAAFNN